MPAASRVTIAGAGGSPARSAPTSSRSPSAVRVRASRPSGSATGAQPSAGPGLVASVGTLGSGVPTVQPARASATNPAEAYRSHRLTGIPQYHARWPG